MRRFILCCMAAALLSMAADAAAPRWEVVTASGEAIELRSDSNDVEITTREGYVYVANRQPVTVKLFTILGQLIIQENLPAGVHRFRLSSRGIYLLKAGNLTRRITV